MVITFSGGQREGHAFLWGTCAGRLWFRMMLVLMSDQLGHHRLDVVESPGEMLHDGLERPHLHGVDGGGVDLALLLKLPSLARRGD